MRRQPGGAGQGSMPARPAGYRCCC
jgi:hypothetical protein